MGHTVGEELRRARLRQAESMLRRTDASLSEIAARCGYADAAHLTRAFRHAKGTNPGAARSGRGATGLR